MRQKIHGVSLVLDGVTVGLRQGKIPFQKVGKGLSIRLFDLCLTHQ